MKWDETDGTLTPLGVLVAPENRAKFVRYHNGQIWYAILKEESGPDGALIGRPLDFEFPIPIGLEHRAVDEAPAIMFVRYIRKHMIAMSQKKVK